MNEAGTNSSTLDTGSCFKKDVLSLVYMAESRHLTEVADYWRAVVVMNEYQTKRFTNRILAALNNTLANKNIAILGYAYKKNTSDTRESAAITVVGQLIAENARVRIYDPKVQEAQIRRDLSREFGDAALDRCLTVCEDAYSACHKAAAVVILTEWDEVCRGILPLFENKNHRSCQHNTRDR